MLRGMRYTRFTAFTLVSFLIPIFAWSVFAGQQPKESAPEQQKRDPAHGETAPGAGPMFVKYEDAAFQKITPELGEDGPEIAILRVDPKSGATQLLIRSVAAMRVPPHWHSANETHTVIKGVQVYECGDVRETLTSGGFNYIPAKDPHRAWLSAGALVFITVDGPWDVNWVASPPTREDLGQAAVADVIKAADATPERGG